VAEAPDDAVDRLYGLPLDAFVSERDARARELRGAGRREEAAAVKALPKPTVAAWAANQAVRSQGRAARELWEAGDALAATQEAVLSGRGSGADLRAASERERAAVDPLVEAARGLLTTEGGEMSEATLDRVRDTLHAAAIDPDVRDEVAAGRAIRERTPRGLFGGEATSSAPAGRKGRAAKPAPDATPTGRKGRAAKPAAPEPSARERAAEAAARKREEAAARKRERDEAAARKRSVKAAGARVAKAEQALAQAEERSAAAAKRLEDARGKERAAMEALADARAELRAAERG
jgi:hypothetical protein